MIKRSIVLSVALAALTVPTFALSGWAQGNGASPVRATNMARMAAEKLNGGLQVYRVAACMHQQGGGPCLLKASAQGYLFRFYGGSPGWQQLRQRPTVETEILVAPDGRSVREVIYNGPPRSGTLGS